VQRQTGAHSRTYVAEHVQQHVASMNGSNKQCDEQHFQPHFAQHVEVSKCESTIRSPKTTLLTAV